DYGTWLHHGGGQFRDVATDGEGRIYVAAGAGGLQVYDTTGEVPTHLTTFQLGLVEGLPEGNVVTVAVSDVGDAHRLAWIGVSLSDGTHRLLVLDVSLLETSLGTEQLVGAEPLVMSEVPRVAFLRDGDNTYAYAAAGELKVYKARIDNDALIVEDLEVPIEPEGLYKFADVAVSTMEADGIHTPLLWTVTTGGENWVKVFDLAESVHLGEAMAAQGLSEDLTTTAHIAAEGGVGFATTVGQSNNGKLTRAMLVQEAEGKHELSVQTTELSEDSSSPTDVAVLTNYNEEGGALVLVTAELLGIEGADTYLYAIHVGDAGSFEPLTGLAAVTDAVGRRGASAIVLVDEADRRFALARPGTGLETRALQGEPGSFSWSDSIDLKAGSGEDGWLSGDLLAVAQGHNGLLILDIQAKQPVVLYSAPEGLVEPVHRVTGHGDHLLLAGTHHVWPFEMKTDEGEATVNSQDPIPYGDGVSGQALEMEVAGDRLFVLVSQSEEGASIRGFDLSSGLPAEGAGVLENAAYTDLDVVGNRLYVAKGSPAASVEVHALEGLEASGDAVGTITVAWDSVGAQVFIDATSTALFAVVQDRLYYLPLDPLTGVWAGGASFIEQAIPAVTPTDLKVFGETAYIASSDFSALSGENCVLAIDVRDPGADMSWPGTKYITEFNRRPGRLQVSDHWLVVGQGLGGVKIRRLNCQ
ncbi:MAG: hypothetical protein QF464_04480, partial [Myxococcota bacterium]|nr:hypothetical protein [Myxococcota bacterium]